ncbi:MAG: hypothetical protein GXP55_09095 [Deltaproteobacteria bacterium]|nr:hypothetical protein [Deltaproteobacteria bacterium]
MSRPRTYTTDLSHFLSDNGDVVVEGRAGELALYFGLMVEFGSVMDVEAVFVVPMPCSMPGRRGRCGTRLVVGRPSSDALEWSCPSCGDGGRITSWRRSCFDLSDGVLGAKFEAADEERVDAVVPLEELWAMRRLGGGTAQLRRLLVDASNFGEGYALFEASYPELEGLRDLATAVAELTRGADRRRLDRFAARLDAFRTTLPEFLEPSEGPVNLDDAIAGGVPATAIALARDIATRRGHDDVYVEDLLEAESELEQRRKMLLN